MTPSESKPRTDALDEPFVFRKTNPTWVSELVTMREVLAVFSPEERRAMAVEIIRTDRDLLREESARVGLEVREEWRAGPGNMWLRFPLRISTEHRTVFITPVESVPLASKSKGSRA